MDFTSKEDIDSPIADVFEALSDFESFERSAIRRGIDVERIGDISTPENGLAWDAKFNFRGKARELRIALKSYDPVTRILLSGDSSGLNGETEIELMALSPRRTRVTISLNLTAKTLSGRLLLQSFKLARGSLNKKFKARAADFARLTEERLNRTA